MSNPISTENQQPTGDIHGGAEIRRLVDAFYAKVQLDPLLGPVFNDVAKVDWGEHLPKLYAFWESVLFGSGDYRGNPMLAHLHLDGKETLTWEMFERWLALFHETVDELFFGPVAHRIKLASANMGQVIHSRVQMMRKGSPLTGGGGEKEYARRS